MIQDTFANRTIAHAVDRLRNAADRLSPADLAPPIVPLSAAELLALPAAAPLGVLRGAHCPEIDCDIFMSIILLGARTGWDWPQIEGELETAVPLRLRQVLRESTLGFLAAAVGGSVVAGVLSLAMPLRLHIPCLLDPQHDHGGLFGHPERTPAAARRASLGLAAWCDEG